MESSTRSPGPADPRAGFTLVELLVVVAIIGVLVGLLLPAVQAAREAGRRTGCANNVRQIGLALHHAHDHLSRFPSGWMGNADDEPGWGWATGLLPQFDEQALHDEIDFRRPIYDPADPDRHAVVRVRVLAPFRCPSDGIGPTEVSDGLFGIGIDDGQEEHEDDHEGEEHAHGDTHGFHPVDGQELGVLCEVAKANYVGCFGWEFTPDGHPAAGDGVFFRNSRIGFKQIVDGASKTVLLGERGSRLGCSTWVGVIAGAEAARSRPVAVGDHIPETSSHFDDFSSGHPGGVTIGFADASTRFLGHDIAEEVLHSLCTRAGGEAVPGDF